VDQAISSTRDTAAFARRVVLRTLTVVGGAAAGTAIAWCISSASASADITGGVVPVPEVPVVQQLVEPVTGTLGTAADATADKLQEAPAPPKSLRELGERVKQATTELGERAEEQLPACADSLCGLEQVGRAAPSTGDAVEQTGRAAAPQPAPAPAVPAAEVADPGVDPDATAERTATGRAYTDGMSRRGSPAPGMPSFPGFPGWPAPAAPFPAPGHTGFAGQADSSPFAACPWQDRVPTLVRGLAAPAGEVTTAGRPGAQPGVTPD
jgi:hypothetical protein